MAIYCSCLPNDQDMIKALGSIAVPLPIDHGDATFSGVNSQGDPLLISIERKHIGDLAACITDGRYLAQSQKAKELGADVLILILECGETRANPDDGILEMKVWQPFVNSYNQHKMREEWVPVRPTLAYSRFTAYLFELTYLLGVVVMRSSSVKETARIIEALYSWFQRTDHQSLNTIYKRPPPTVEFVRPSLIRRIACELPGLGWDWSQVVSRRFRTVAEMVAAGVDDWAKLELTSDKGRKHRLGTKTAEKIVIALKGTKVTT
jgi:ERCC4-type nuclease